ncbi:MAG: glycosyltransferase family 4 protein [Desulfomonilaceae bacterium]
MDNIRLVHVTTTAETQWAFLKGQNLFLAAKGFQVHAAASPDPTLEMLAKRDGAVVHPVPMAPGKLSFHDAASLVGLLRVMLRIKPHIAHVSTPKAAFLGALAARLARVPIRIYFIRGLHTEGQTGLRRTFYRFAERVTARLCNAWICVSPSLLRYARAQGILSEHQGFVPGHGMSNGVDVTHFHPVNAARRHDLGRLRESLSIPPAAPVIGYVGRLVKDKGICDLAEAWREIRVSKPAAHLLLVGAWRAGPEAVPDDIRTFLETDRRVHCVGHVPDPAPYYAIMSVLAFPSHGTEGFPNAPMEAAAMEVPSVVTDVVGCVDAVIDGVTGAVVPRGNVAEFTQAITTYLENENLRRGHGVAARHRAEAHYRPDIVWKALYDEYVRLLEEHGLCKAEH